jgi:hypothetical protein
MTEVHANRKRIEVEQKLNSLNEEFMYWLTQSNPQGAFEKHHSQIRAVTSILQELQQRVNQRVAAAQTPDQILTVSHIASQMTLSVHRIWEYFRSKFIQRREERLSQYLRAADEFAWACYQPVLDVANAAQPGKFRKEPPLVFCNGGSSPFSVSRERSFEGEAVANELLSGPELRRVLNSLPLPVIGVPWFQVAHWPDALVIAHEVGHTVEDDFHLTDSLHEHLETALQSGIDATRHAAWRAWIGELFADLYGCLATGPAFVGALMDFLVRAPGALAQENRLEPNWGEYPTTPLRLLFNFEVLVVMGFIAEADSLRATWQTLCPAHQLQPYDADIAPIVTALLTRTYPSLGNQTLLDFESQLPEPLAKKTKFRFSAEQQKKALQTVQALKTGEALTQTQDFRVLLAASRLAYEADPKSFVEKNSATKILTRINGLTKPGIRAGERTKTTAQVQNIMKQDQQTGERMFAELWKQAEMQ